MALLVIKQLVIMALIALGGFIFAKSFGVCDKEQKFLSKLLLYFINPFLIVNSFNIPFDSSKLKQLLFVIVISALAVLLMIVFSFCVYSSSSLDKKRFTCLEKVALVFTNCGFVGIPLIRGVLGEEGVFFLMGYLIIFNIGIWTYGYYQVSGSISVKKIFTNPNIIAIFIGLILFCSPVKLPEMIATPIKMIGDLNTAASMILIGILFADFKLPSEDRKTVLTRVTLFTIYRLVVCSIINLIFLYFVHKIFDGMPQIKMMIYTVLICSMCPAATSVPSLACVFDKDASYASLLVSITSLLCMISLPAFVALAEFFIK